MFIGVYGYTVLNRSAQQCETLDELKAACADTYCSGMSDEAFQQLLVEYLNQFTSLAEAKLDVAREVERFGGQTYLDDCERPCEFSSFINGND